MSRLLPLTRVQANPACGTFLDDNVTLDAALDCSGEPDQSRALILSKKRTK
jgi:hypothetical protein